MSNTELIERRDRSFGKGAPLFYREPLHIVRGEGVWLHEADGRKFIDMYNNVPCVGHANPLVVEAMHRQAGTLNVHSRYLHEGVIDYAERLTGLHDGIESVVFTCSGTEANEVAMAMARTATRGKGFICTDAAYHGNSKQVGQLTYVRTDKQRDPHIRSIPFPQTYRPIADGVSETELTELYLQKVRDAIADLQAENIPLAGMLVCPILANEGLPNIPAGFMTRAAEIVREAGGLFIVDEVQSGFCRTGQWWGYGVMDVIPDIVTMGKPMGNGMPLSGAAASHELVSSYRERFHYFNTFASCPLQAAAGSAVIEFLEQEKIAEQVSEVGAYMRGELRRMAESCEPMAEVRGHGLFIGLEWVSDRQEKTPDREGAIDVINAMKDKGFLMSNAGALGNVVKIRPPLVFAREHADLFLTAFAEMIRELHG
jgi:4-aminobutyrate aminotransferase-like enzyme